MREKRKKYPSRVLNTPRFLILAFSILSINANLSVIPYDVNAAIEKIYK